MIAFGNYDDAGSTGAVSIYTVRLGVGSTAATVCGCPQCTGTCTCTYGNSSSRAERSDAAALRAPFGSDAEEWRRAHAAVQAKQRFLAWLASFREMPAPNGGPLPARTPAKAQRWLAAIARGRH